MSELDESIGQVESLIPKQQIPGQGQRRSSNRSVLLITLLIVGMLVIVNQWRALFGPDQAVLDADAGALLMAVDAALQSQQLETGQLPQGLPDAAADQWVTFESVDGGYRLTTRVNGTFKQLERRGDRSSLNGVEQEGLDDA